MTNRDRVLEVYPKARLRSYGDWKLGIRTECIVDGTVSSNERILGVADGRPRSKAWGEAWISIKRDLRESGLLSEQGY